MQIKVSEVMLYTWRNFPQQRKRYSIFDNAVLQYLLRPLPQRRNSFIARFSAGYSQQVLDIYFFARNEKSASKMKITEIDQTLLKSQTVLILTE